VRWLRAGLVVAGLALAGITVLLDSPRLGWGAIALLVGSLIIRLLQRSDAA
jgi:hypothetical protein